MIFLTKTSEPDVSKFPIVDSLKEFSNVLTDYGTAFSDATCFTRELMDPIVLPEGKTVLDVFKVCFDDDSTLMEEYHKDRNDTNQKWEPWRPAVAGSPAFCGQRRFTCTTVLSVMISKSCPFTEYQRYAFMNIGGNEPTLVVQLSGQAEGVMFADAFRAEALLVFAQSGKESFVTMRAFGHLQFLRDVWIKGKILRVSLDTEMPKCYRKLGSMLVDGLRQGDNTAFSDVVELNKLNVLPLSPPDSVMSGKSSSSVSGVICKFLVCGEFLLEVVGAVFCVNALIHSYFFAVPTGVTGLEGTVFTTDMASKTLFDAGQGMDGDALSSFVVDLIRPALLAVIIFLLCIIFDFMQKTVMRMNW